MPKKLIFFLFLFVSLLICTFTLSVVEGLHPVNAQQQGADLATVYDIADKQSQEGDILSSTDQGITRSSATNDSNIFGVFQNKPVMVFKRFDNSGYPIVRSGTALVNVTTLNGDIALGDYITSSPIPGKGQKSNPTGYVVGKALAKFSSQEGQKIAFGDKTVSSGQILVAIQPEQIGTNPAFTPVGFLGLIGSSFLKNIQEPSQFSQTIRYIIAGVIIILSSTFAFWTFSRSIPKSIEAIGRNPLAARSIQISVVLNVGMTIGVILLSILASFLIIRL